MREKYIISPQVSATPVPGLGHINLGSGSKEILNKANVCMVLSWDVCGSSIGITVNLPELGQNYELGYCCVGMGQQAKLAGYINKHTKAEVYVHVEESPLAIHFEAKAASKPFWGIWKGVSSGKQTILL